MSDSPTRGGSITGDNLPSQGSNLDHQKETIYKNLKAVQRLASELQKATKIVASYSAFAQDAVAEGAQCISKTSYVLEGVIEPASFEKTLLKLKPDRNSKKFDKVIKELADRATWIIITSIRKDWDGLLKMASHCTAFVDLLERLDLERVEKEFMVRTAEEDWLNRVEPEMNMLRTSIKMSEEIVCKRTAAPCYINTIKDAKVAFGRACHKNDVTMLDAASFQQAVEGIYNASIREQSRSLQINREKLESLAGHLASLAELESTVKPMGHSGSQGVVVVDFNIIPDIMEFGMLAASV